MSYIYTVTPKAGQPLFKDLACLREAFEFIGFNKVETGEIRSDNGTVQPVLQAYQFADFSRARTGKEPVVVGVVNDPANPGCYSLAYEQYYGHYDGTDTALGASYSSAIPAPRLKKIYDMMCDKAAAAEAGDAIEFMTVQDLRMNYSELSQRYPELAALELPAPTSLDHEHYVSLVQTGQRA